MTGEQILIVEDERAVARGLEYALRAEGYQVRWVETGRDALSAARLDHPHLILLDIRLPDISGFDVCRQLRSEDLRMPIVMVTARDEEIDRVLGLELGADDYVVKPFSLRELISRIRALLRRSYGDLAAATSAGRVIFGDIDVDLEKMLVTRQGELLSLTPTEYRLLRHLVTNPNRPFGREDLIEAVWGYDSSIGSGRTVDVHIRHLRQKLEDDPANPQRIVTVRGVGYKFQP